MFPTNGKPPRGPIETREQAVYLLSVPSGHYKIGRAKSPEDRIRLLQCGNPERITLEGSSQISAGGLDAAEMERRVHQLLRDYRTSGEWFKASTDLIYGAWKYAWMSMAHPDVTSRYERLKSRQALSEVAARVMASSDDPDVLAVCDAVLAGVAEACPHCVARRAAKTASQQKWRAGQKKSSGAAAEI